METPLGIEPGKIIILIFSLFNVYIYFNTVTPSPKYKGRLRHAFFSVERIDGQHNFNKKIYEYFCLYFERNIFLFAS